MKSEKETIYDYAAELKLLSFKEELECTLMSFSEGNFISFRMGAMGVAVCSSSLSQL